jgi:hypothetical protein
MLRVKCIAGIAVGLLAGTVAFVSPARAVPVQIDLTINFAPPDPIFSPLTGTPQFWSTSRLTDAPITTLIPGNPIFGSLTAGQTFMGSFEPPDPCFAATSCNIGFSFSGMAGTHDAFALASYSADPPLQTPTLLIGILQPGDPCFNGGICHESGPIVAFSTGVTVGSWDVTIEAATPLPGAFPLFATGLGALGLLGWRRKRKNA